MEENKIKWDITSEPIEKYDLPLVAYYEDRFIFGFSNITEEDGITTVHVGRQIDIPIDNVKDFLSTLLRSLVDYEKEYKNGKGITLDD